MPPTPEQLLIQPNQQLDIKAPQVSLQVQPTQVIQEGEVSFPSQPFIMGQIDYGLNWQFLGEKAFKVGAQIYEDLLKYNVNKTVGDIKDKKYDVITRMNNLYQKQYEDSLNPNYVEQDNEQTLSDSIKNLQDEYKRYANERLGLKNKDGNNKDIWQTGGFDATGKPLPDFTLDGLGTYWIDAVETSRGGLAEISNASEKIASDLHKTTLDQFEMRRIDFNFRSGRDISSTEWEKIEPRYTAITTGNEPIPATPQQVVEWSKLNETIGQETGRKPLRIVDGPGGQPIAFINKASNIDEVSRVIGPVGVEQVYNAEYEKLLSANGTNVPPNVYRRLSQLASTDSLSDTQVIELRSALAYLQPQKLESIMSGQLGTNLSAKQMARMYWGWLNAGTNQANREEVNYQTWRTQWNNFGSQQGVMAKALMDKINRYSSSIATTEPKVSADMEERLKSTMEMFKVTFSQQTDASGNPIIGVGVLPQQRINEITKDAETFIDFLGKHPEFKPYVMGMALTYDSLLTDPNIDKAKIRESVVKTFSNLGTTDRNGQPILFRHGMYSLVQLRAENLKEAVKSLGMDELQIGTENAIGGKRQGSFKVSSLNPQQLAWSFGVLPSQTNKQMRIDVLAAVDSSLGIPYDNPLEPDERLALIGSLRSVNTNNPLSQNISEEASLSNAIRIGFATNPGVIKAFNNGEMPQTKDDYIRVASKAYISLGPPELWSWDTEYDLEDDEVYNSKNGGIPMGVSYIPFTTETGMQTNLLEDRNVMTSSSNRFIKLRSLNGTYLSTVPWQMFTGENGNNILQTMLNSIGQTAKHPTYQLGRINGQIEDGIREISGDKDYGVESVIRGYQQGTLTTNEYFDKQMSSYIAKQDNKEAFQIPVSLEQVKINLRNPKFLDKTSLLIAQAFSDESTFASRSASPQSVRTMLGNIMADDRSYSLILQDLQKDNKPITTENVIKVLAKNVALYRDNKHNFIYDAKTNVYQPTIVKFWENQNNLISERQQKLQEAFRQTNQKVETIPQVSIASTPEVKQLKNPYPYNVTTFDTILLPSEEAAFINWKNQYAPNDSGQDYDLRGAFKSGLKPDETGHWPDTWKKPSHPTFSTDSVYASVKPEMAGKWNEKPENNQYPEGAVIDENTGQYYLKPKQVSPGAVSDKQRDIWWEILGDKDGAGEGLRLKAYQDKGGVWTVGYGTTRYSDGTPVKKGDTVTEEEAVDMANYKIYNDIIPTLEKTIPTWNDMNPNQQASIVSFAYNYGENFYGRPNFETITKALSNKENFVDVPAALKLYNKGFNQKTKKKEVQGGLVKRRAKEGQIWTRNSETPKKFDERNLNYLKTEYESFDLNVLKIPKNELNIVYDAIISKAKESFLFEKYSRELELKLERRLDGSDDKLYMQLDKDHPDLAKAKEDAQKKKAALMRTKFYINTRVNPEKDSKGTWNLNNALILYEQRVKEIINSINRIHYPNKV